MEPVRLINCGFGAWARVLVRHKTAPTGRRGPYSGPHRRFGGRPHGYPVPPTRHPSSYTPVEISQGLFDIFKD